MLDFNTSTRNVSAWQRKLNTSLSLIVAVVFALPAMGGLDAAELVSPTPKLAPGSISIWEGALTRAVLDAGPPLPDIVPGEVVSFTVIADDEGIATSVDLQFTAHTAVLDANNELICYAGGLVGGSANTAGPFSQIFLSGDGFSFVFASGTDAFFSGVNGSGNLEGEGFDFTTGMPVDLALNRAQGSVNFQYDYQLLVNQQCGDLGGSGGGFCSQPCTWFFAAHCVTNCDGNGLIRFAQDAYQVDETAGSIAIQVLRTGGAMGAVSVDFSTEMATAMNAATSDVDYSFTSGTLNWDDGDISDKTINIPILLDALVEGEEVFNVRLSNPMGDAELGPLDLATIAIDDRPDLTVLPFLVDVNTLRQSTGAFIIPNVTVTVKNIATGGQDAPAVMVTASDDFGFSESFNVGTLGPGGSAQLIFDYDLSSAIQAGDGQTPGNQLTLTVDPGQVIIERLENNNEASSEVLVDVRPSITALTPTFTLDGSFFLGDVPVANEVKISVDWNGLNLAGNGGGSLWYRDLRSERRQNRGARGRHRRQPDL